MTEKIQNALIKLNFNPSYKGFNYLTKVILLFHNNVSSRYWADRYVCEYISSNTPENHLLVKSLIRFSIQKAKWINEKNSIERFSTHDVLIEIYNEVMKLL